MKWALLLSLAFVISVTAQNANIGAFSYGSGRAYSHQNVITSLNLADKPSAVEIRGEFRQLKNGLALVEVEEFSNGSWGMVTVAVTNYPNSNQLVTGRSFYSTAISKGIITDENGYKTECYEFFDLYTYRAAKAAKAQRVAEDNAERERQAHIIAKENAKAIALKSNQDAAFKGDAYGLMRMGERYRDGDGVEKDLSKARDCLKRATDAGSITAKEELSKLPAK